MFCFRSVYFQVLGAAPEQELIDSGNHWAERLLSLIMLFRKCFSTIRTDTLNLDENRLYIFVPFLGWRHRCETCINSTKNKNERRGARKKTAKERRKNESEIENAERSFDCQDFKNGILDSWTGIFASVSVSDTSLTFIKELLTFFIRVNWKQPERQLFLLTHNLSKDHVCNTCNTYVYACFCDFKLVYNERWF